MNRVQKAFQNIALWMELLKDRDERELIFRRIRPSRFFPLSVLFSRKKMVQWEFQPARLVVVWVGPNRHSRGKVTRRWPDRLSKVMFERRGWILGPVFFGVEGHPIITITPEAK